MAVIFCFSCAPDSYSAFINNALCFIDFFSGLPVFTIISMDKLIFAFDCFDFYCFNRCWAPVRQQMLRGSITQMRFVPTPPAMNTSPSLKKRYVPHNFDAYLKPTYI